jgi:hypothetical protein
MRRYLYLRHEEREEIYDLMGSGKSGRGKSGSEDIETEGDIEEDEGT